MQNNNQYTFFFHLTSPFSNFHPAKFIYKEFTFISNEQFMMFSKAKNFKDEETAAKILALNNTPLARDFIEEKISRLDIVNDKQMAEQWNKLMMSIKKLGREVKNYDDEFWSQKRKSIVLFGAREKFKQNDDLKEILLNTGHTIMVETAPRDSIWGIGLSEYDAKRTPPEQWPGLNLLGKVLDKLKEEFRNELISESTATTTSDQLIYHPIEVLNFYHIGKQIPEDGLYIGRANRNLGLSQSLFANPFAMKDQSEEERARVIAEFEDYLWQQIANNKIAKEDLLQLNGKKLCCYCAPRDCHGHVLQKTVKLLIEHENDFDHIVQEYQHTRKMKP